MAPSKDEYYIGIMSGTSLDAIDAALVCFDANSLSVVETHSIAITSTLKQTIMQLCQSGYDEINKGAQLDRHLGKMFAECSLELLKKTHLKPADIKGIGCHGQTVRHQPQGLHPYTVQIGDPNTLAYLTSITTVADFRRRDIAAGGQGAPLVPPFHEFAFNSPSSQRVVVNIGGMANISLLTNDHNHLLGFDTGPGNVLLNTWIHQHLNKEYDKNGEWSKSGSLNQTLLADFLSDPYFRAPPPKSTGREYFNNKWLNKYDLKPFQIEDVQTTLTHLTASSISESILQYAPKCNEVILCGGGAFNDHLTTLLNLNLKGIKVSTSTEVGIDSQWVECAAFAWLAKQTLDYKPGNNPKVTGAKEAVILGGVYYS